MLARIRAWTKIYPRITQCRLKAFLDSVASWRASPPVTGRSSVRDTLIHQRELSSGLSINGVTVAQSRGFGALMQRFETFCNTRSVSLRRIPSF